MKFQVAPSLLAADFWNIGKQIEEVTASGAEVLHIDIMDGHFVPNLTMGPGMVKSIKNHTDALLDVHLMVSKPDSFIDAFVNAGADWISFHIESSVHPHRICQNIKDSGCKAGLALNPGTPISHLESMIEDIDFVLLMSVNPGYGGQSFIHRSNKRLGQLQALIDRTDHTPFIQIDGGVGPHNVVDLYQRGVSVAVAGSSIFAQPAPGQAVKHMISLVEASHET